MSKAIYVVGGSKGGVGKSLVSMSLIHNLTQRGEEVFVIDADTSNPDDFKSYEEEVACELVNLDEADGWIRFVNICDEHKGRFASPSRDRWRGPLSSTLSAGSSRDAPRVALRKEGAPNGNGCPCNGSGRSRNQRRRPDRLSHLAEGYCSDGGRHLAYR